MPSLEQRSTMSSKKTIREQANILNNQIGRISDATLITGTGVIAFRKGVLIAYPPVVAWARMQSFFLRAKGSGATNSFPFCSLYTAKQSARKYVDSLNVTLAVLLTCSLDDLNFYAKSLFDYVRSTQSLAGLESNVLSTINALGKSQNPLFNEGLSIWSNYRSTCVQSSNIALVDKQLGGIAVVSAIDILNLELGKGVKTNTFMGGLAATDPTTIKIGQNPIERIINERIGNRATAEGLCVGIFISAGAVIGGVAGSFLFPAVGTVTGIQLGTAVLGGIGMMACGAAYPDKEPGKPSSTQTTTTTTTSSTQTSSDNKDSTSDETYSCNTSSSSETSNMCSVDASSDDDSEDDKPDDDDDKMPDPEGDGPNGPNWLDMKTFETLTMPMGDGLTSLVSFGPKGIAFLHDMPIIDFTAQRVVSLGLTATAPAFVNSIIGDITETKNKADIGSQIAKGEWVLYPKDWVMNVNHINTRTNLASSGK